jgi:integrase
MGFGSLRKVLILALRASRTLRPLPVSKLGGKEPLSKFKPAHPAELYALLRERGRFDGKGGLSEKSVHHVHSLLTGALKWAEKNHLLRRGVAADIDAPRLPKGEAKALSTEEVTRLREAAQRTRWAPFLDLALATGARRGELAALRWENVDLDSGKITIRASLSQKKDGIFLKSTKTERARSVHLSPMAAAALRAQKAQQARDRLRFGQGYDHGGFVFTNEAGNSTRPWQSRTRSGVWPAAQPYPRRAYTRCDTPPLRG